VARLFLESSALVKRYIQETGTAWVNQLLNPTTGHLIHVARLTGVEIISAIARRVRTGTLQPAHQAGLIGQFRQEFTKQYLKIEISPALVTEAMSLAETHALRGSDAIQLAAALKVHAQNLATGVPFLLISADGELNTAAQREGLTVDDPTAHP
jgi:uncharacterized protein